MKSEPSKLARLVIAYHEKFGRHAPDSALRRGDARDLAAMLEDSLATGVPISEHEWGRTSPFQYSPRGCTVIVRGENPESATPKKGPDGEWLQ
jgi:hypothetical protein